MADQEATRPGEIEEKDRKRDPNAADRFSNSRKSPPSTQGENQKRAADYLPSVSLPKGGGAIRGLGEKFSVNAATGTSNLSIPLPLSRGRSGFTPQLQLTYDSGSGNGPFGFGWSLGLPAITRKTDKGLPRYCDGDESDVYVLAGAEDLVPVLDSSGARQRGSRTVWGTQYQISFYRPRIEGLFARIERWQAVDTGIAHWRSISRDNVTTLYGYDASSRVVDPSDPSRVYSWLICRSWDDKGNVATYAYAAENGAGVDLTQAHEANRTSETRAVQIYPKTIQYGNIGPWFPDWSATTETALPDGWLFGVVFDFGDHTASPPTPEGDRPWPVRPDPFSTYRAGFEIRTYRRVQRILFFNNFPQEPTAGTNCLVRSLDLVYSDQQTPADPRNPLYTFLFSVTQTGYRQDSTGLIARSLPPLQFAYSTPSINSDILSLDRDSLGNLPEGIDGSSFRFVDLDGEGLPGILSDTDRGWFYKRNCSPNNLVEQADGSALARASFGLMEMVSALPSHSDLSGQQRLLTLAGDGRLDVAELSDFDPGFFKRTTDNSFEPFRRFQSLPQIDWMDPNLRLIDLTGDGLADVLITEDGIFTYYASLGEAGFDIGQIVHVPWDEEKGPQLVLADGTETIFLADMSGDGLNDLVRVRNGEVSYWPNVGYGRFGARVAMDMAPRFDNEDGFDPKRIRLADIDGTGTTDLLYVGEHGVRAWYNQSGNIWSSATTIAVFPTADRLGSVQVLDFLGTGTACLVWSSPLQAGTGAPLLYVDLMGGQKPHLMIGAINNLGAETRVTYAPSTRFYVADAGAGRPWVTRLPFPVQVVERSEVFDWIGRNRLVTRYAYHHGYYDGYEREFRGFGMVEQWDTEEFRTDTQFAGGDFINWDAQSWSPPMLTRTWFHIGAFNDAIEVTVQYASEYWTEPALRPSARTADAAAMRLPDNVLPAGLSPVEVQETYRALKGRALRIETYAQDGSPNAGNPYTVTEQNFTVVCLQNMGDNRHAIFFVHPRETLTFQYERGADDPRVTHAMTLETDTYGNVKRSAAISYARRAGYQPPEPALPATTQSMLAYDQTRLHVSAREQQYTNPIDDPVQWPDMYRTSLPAAANTAEITGIAPTIKGNSITNLFAFDEMDGIWQSVWSGANDIPYEAIPAADVDGAGSPPGTPTRRFLAQTRILYRADDFSALLSPGQLQPRALPGESYQLALTPGLVDATLGSLVTPAILGEGGYVQIPDETGWWIPSGRLFFSAGDGDTPAQELAAALAHFFLPRRALDPFGAIARINWDSHDLLPVETTDAVGNTTSASNDYRVLAPATLTDPNGNRGAVAFDAFGLVTATAVMGKATETLGDQLSGFVSDLDDATLATELANPLANPASLLGNATTRMVHDFGAYFRSRSAAQPAPPAVYTLTRETHVSDLAAGQSTRFQYHFVYSDGFGREIQHKALAAPGPLATGGPQVSPRWIGSGWTIFDNKGRATRKYEPFFTITNAFEFAAQSGVSSTVFYDPPGRVVATLHPDNGWEKVVFDAWRQEMWDGNDTILISDPRTDADVGDYFQRCLVSSAFTSWYNLRIGGTYGATANDQAAQKDAAQKAAAHAATPGVTHFDSQGRSCLVIADTGSGNRFPSRTAFDTEGKPLVVYDALGRRAQEYFYRAVQYMAGADLVGNQLYRINADGGARRALNNIAGNAIRNWDALGHAFRTVYDKAQRPTQRYVSTNGAPEILFDLTVYGEGQASPNLCGRVFRHYDMAGCVENSQFDYAGNLLSQVRQVARAYQVASDWTPLVGLNTAPQLDAASVTLLSAADRFVSRTVYDALDRPIQTVTPHSTGMKPNVIRSGYDEAGLLVSVDAWLQQAAAATTLLDAVTADRHVVIAIAYNARGQRTAITYGNGTGTSSAYDLETFRLTNLITTRSDTFAVDQRAVQALSYYYDPAGNITRIRDDADTQHVVYFNNQRVDPTADYTYDPLYRLVQATGREHLGQTGGTVQAPQQVTNDDSIRINLPQPGDGNAMGIYTENYSYDAVGNILSMAHHVSSGNWTRRYTYAEPSQTLVSETSNRLSTTSLPGDPSGGPYSAAYTYDAHGNMVRMPHLPRLVWDELDRLRSTTRQVVNSGSPVTTFYVYDAGGQRVRKTTNASATAGQIPAPLSERVYLGGVEVYREFAADGTTITLSRETLHIAAGDHPVAFVETRTSGSDPAPAQQVRYQFRNNLGSAALELDDESNIISYEEYFPFGSTSYQAVVSQTDLPKRYRYTDKERDRENDLSYHGARYYVPWLGRWTACDPRGLVDGFDPYMYCRNNPLVRIDSSGAQSKDWGSESHTIVIESEVKIVNPKTGVLETVEKSRVTRTIPARTAQQDPAPPENKGTQSGSSGAGELVIPIGGDIAQYGNVANFMRGTYRAGVQKIFERAQALLKAGKSESEAARWVVEQRNLLKQAVREQGPKLWKAAVELRNQLKYGNKLGPEYDALVASKVASINANQALSEAEKIAEIGKIDSNIVAGVQNTSKEFNAAGSKLRILGTAAQVVGFALTAMTDSPESLPPLPVSREKEVAIEKARLHFGIPANVNIDEHGHRKKESYEQIDILDPHVSDEMDQETEEILWWLGVPITYHAYIPGGEGKKMTWTVPGR